MMSLKIDSHTGLFKFDYSAVSGVQWVIGLEYEMYLYF